MNKDTDRENDMKVDDETSVYIGTEGGMPSIDFGGLFSHPFTNVRPLYTSAHGATDIYSATRYGRRYILKALKEQYRDDPVYNLALAKEFEIGIMLEHPHIRRTVGIETVEGLGRVIVLEYIDGSLLSDLIDSGEITMADGRNLITQVADALAYMHGKKVIHRDLKPSNILVSYGNRDARLIDFSLSDSDEYIVLKNPAGSRRYMAPELSSSPEGSSPVTDIYSLGVIMKEIAGVTRDDELEAAGERCANPDPAQRPQSIADIHLPRPDGAMSTSLSRFLASKTLTFILVTVCIALALLITFLLTDF